MLAFAIIEDEPTTDTAIASLLTCRDRFGKAQPMFPFGVEG
jgi:hypothetical protein